MAPLSRGTGAGIRRPIKLPPSSMAALPDSMANTSSRLLMGPLLLATTTTGSSSRLQLQQPPQLQRAQPIPTTRTVSRGRATTGATSSLPQPPQLGVTSSRVGMRSRRTGGGTEGRLRLPRMAGTEAGTRVTGSRAMPSSSTQGATSSQRRKGAQLQGGMTTQRDPPRRRVRPRVARGEPGGYLHANVEQCFFASC